MRIASGRCGEGLNQAWPASRPFYSSDIPLVEGTQALYINGTVVPLAEALLGNLTNILDGRVGMLAAEFLGNNDAFALFDVHQAPSPAAMALKSLFKEYRP